MRPNRLTRLGERAVVGADHVVGLPPVPAPYLDAYVGIAQASTIIAATRLGLWRALPGTTSGLAQATGSDPDRLATLLNALRALRYVARRGQRWRTTRRSRRWLGAGDGTGLDATVGELAWLNGRGLQRLDEVVRGAPPEGLHERDAGDPVWDGYQRSMVELAGQVLPVARTTVPAHARRLLDIGGGPGTFAIALCRERPGLQVTIADLEGAAARGRERVRQAGLEDRIGYAVGDAATADVGTGYDAVTCHQLLHNLDRPTALAILVAARKAARPGGQVSVLDIDHEGSRVGALASIVFLTWMGTRAWSGEEVAAMAREAGLQDVELTYPVRLGGGLVVRGTAP